MEGDAQDSFSFGNTGLQTLDYSNQSDSLGGSAIPKQSFEPTKLPSTLESFRFTEMTESIPDLTGVATPEEFEVMVGDLRRNFIGWLKKTESELRNQREKLQKSRHELEIEKQKVWQRFLVEKQAELEKIADERRKFNRDMSIELQQLKESREGARQAYADDRAKLNEEKARFRQKLLMDHMRFRSECEQLDRQKNLVRECNLAAETVVDLNVGGTIFETSRRTLLQQPGSMLEAIFSGRNNVSRDKFGHIFMDRDSELFAMILNFLRNSSYPPMPKDWSESDALCRESEYLGIKFFPYPSAFAIGGHDGTQHLRSMEVLDVGKQCWRPCKAMSTERVYFGVTGSRNTIYCFGGQNLDYKALAEMECYDCLLDKWIVSSGLSTPRRNCSAALLDERVFAIGGFDGTNILSSVESHDPRIKKWIEVAPLNVPRSSPMCCTLGNRIYVLGGTKGERLRTVEIFDQRMNAWEDSRYPMVEVRSAGSAATVLSYLFVLGGVDNAHNISTTVEMWNPELLAWKFMKYMPEARMDCAASAVSDSLMVVGGQNTNVLDSSVYFRPEINDWQNGPSMISPRYGHGLCVVNI